jgi:glyoxylase I family protein
LLGDGSHHNLVAEVQAQEDFMAIDVRSLVPLLQVFDMPASINFYCGVLGFEVVSTDSKQAPNFDWVLLRLNGVELMLNTAYEAPNRPTIPDPERTVAYREIGLFFGCPNVEDAYARIRAMGVNIEKPKVAPYGMKQLYVVDPDGYVLCFQWSTDPTREHAGR